MKLTGVTTCLVWTLAVLFTPVAILFVAVVICMVAEWIADRRERKEEALTA